MSESNVARRVFPRPNAHVFVPRTDRVRGELRCFDIAVVGSEHGGERKAPGTTGSERLGSD